MWHAGDIGSIETVDDIASFKPLIAVYGNIDDAKVREIYPETAKFECEQIAVNMLHIGGYPGRYTPKAFKLLRENSPNILICGHSHILKIFYDKQFNTLHINPGAAGSYGFHKVRTAVRFIISDDKMTDMEVGEWNR